MYLAHRAKDGREQSILEHSEKVAKLSQDFASALDLGNIGYQIGLAHDIGKYSDAFQRRINGSSQHVDHSTAGAIENDWFPPASFCIAGHHGGIPDGGAPIDSPDDITLYGRLKRSPNDGTLEDYSSFHEEIKLVNANAEFAKKLERFAGSNFEFALAVRFLFSCLVDADYLDTECFMSDRGISRGGYDSILELAPKLDSYIAKRGWDKPKNDLNKARWRVAQECEHAGRDKDNLLQVTVPTGGGKTIATLILAFARVRSIAEAVQSGDSSRKTIERIIIVIPYISIIEQTAGLLKNIFGSKNVLEHHSNLDPALDSDEDNNDLHRLSTENWDAPIIITTNVQFFESLMSNKPSHCRKLHNIANSVVIFDEAQMLPLDYLVPCTEIISSLVRDWGVTAVLSTATQPSLERFFDRDVTVREVCSDVTQLFDFFKRNEFDFIHVDERAEVAKRAARSSSVLVISNTRKGAREVYDALPKVGRYHLSTLMYPRHRRRVMDAIRTALNEIANNPESELVCRVSSTSLIEAGVDLDFNYVIREQSGLDSIVQAAGRCNREMRRSCSESIVSVFSCSSTYGSDMNRQIEVANEVLSKGYERPDTPECISDYFDTLHRLDNESLDKKLIVNRFNDSSRWPFKTVAEDFKYIESYTYTVIVPKEEEAEKLCKLLRYQGGNRETVRNVQQFGVSIRPNEYENLVRCGAIETIGRDYGVLLDLELYDDEMGLGVVGKNGEAIIV